MGRPRPRWPEPGRLATRTWARGTVTTYTYDAGQLVHTNYSDATPDVTVAYDSFGRQTSVTNGVATTTYTYDPATLAVDTETVGYDLDADSTPDFTRGLDRSQDTLKRDNGWQLKDGTTVENQVAYAFDTAGRLGSVTSPTGTFTYGYRSNSMGLLQTVTGPAHTVTNTWNATRDVLTEKENKVGTTVISAYDYAVNSLGQRTEVAKAGSAFTSTRSIAWGYDVLGQVVMADSSITGFDRAYKYDGIGNRKEAVDSLTLSETDNYVANALNQYTHVGSIEPVYDLDGNATAYPVPADLSANSVLGWDGENRLISATVDSVTTTYHYDSGSRRIFQTTGSTTTVYVYDGWNPVVEFSTLDFETFDLRRSYTWGSDLSGSLQGAGGVGGLLLITDHSTLGTPSYFPTFDGNGNVSEYLDGIGTIEAHYEYDPFGRTTVASGTKAGDFSHRFSTKPLDSATGLLYYGYRWFDPSTGTWPTRDPIGEKGGMNLYGFISNHSLSKVDFLGMKDDADYDDDDLGPKWRRYVALIFQAVWKCRANLEYFDGYWKSKEFYALGVRTESFHRSEFFGTDDNPISRIGVYYIVPAKLAGPQVDSLPAIVESFLLASDDVYSETREKISDAIKDFLKGSPCPTRKLKIDCKGQFEEFGITYSSEIIRYNGGTLSLPEERGVNADEIL